MQMSFFIGKYNKAHKLTNKEKLIYIFRGLPVLKTEIPFLGKM